MPPFFNLFLRPSKAKQLLALIDSGAITNLTADSGQHTELTAGNTASHTTTLLQLEAGGERYEREAISGQLPPASSPLSPAVAALFYDDDIVEILEQATEITERQQRRRARRAYVINRFSRTSFRLSLSA